MLFFLLANLTDDGLQACVENPDYFAEACDSIDVPGAKLLARYATLGQYDFVVMVEADTAQKTEERHDYTVFQCWGKGYEGGIYLIDQFRKKVEYSELKQRFKDFWYKHNSI